MCMVLLLIPAIAAAQRPPRAPQKRPRRPAPQKPVVPPPPPADLLIVNGKVFTATAGAAFAEALAIRGDRIVAVGPTAEMQKMAGPDTRTIDAAGRVVVPGFNDAHTHPGTELAGIRLDQGSNPMPDPAFKEIQKLVAAAAAASPKGTWILGRIGPTVIDDAEATRFGLDEVSKEHPVLLRAWTGHGTFFNSAAMHALGLSDSEPDPPGGFFTRLKKGGNKSTLSGFAHEYAEFRLFRKAYEQASDEEIAAAFKRFAEEASSFGITSVQAVMTSHDADRVARILSAANLPIRVRLIRFPLVSPAAWQPPSDTNPPAPGSMVAVSGTKWILDGSPVERLAFFKQPYADRAGWKGQPNFADTAVRPMFLRALESREQLLLHAGGDGAIEQAFSAMTAAGSALRWQSRRVRIEHGDGMTSDLIARAQKLGVVLVQNPSHFALRETMVSRFGATRAAALQPLKSVLAAGVPVSIGSDGPLNPGLNLMFATSHPGNPEEALSREEAVRAYTLGSAYAQFAEQEKGTIAPGMLADVAILSGDIFTIPADALPATHAVTTIVGGKVVFERQQE